MVHDDNETQSMKEDVVDVTSEDVWERLGIGHPHSVHDPVWGIVAGTHRSMASSDGLSDYAVSLFKQAARNQADKGYGVFPSGVAVDNVVSLAISAMDLFLGKNGLRREGEKIIDSEDSLGHAKRVETTRHDDAGGVRNP